MSNEISTRIKLKRDTEANWGLKNPVILNGELILVDTAENGVRVKVGDGSSTYSELPFADEDLRGLIGDTAVSEQITEAVSKKMDKQDPTGYGNVSFGRQSGTNVGSNSVVIGNNSQATNTNTIAIGSGVTASSNNSIAIGASTTASGENSVAIGIGATASGVKSLALGDHNVASGEYATAMGCWTNAPGTAATSLGNGTNANGWGAVASGIVATAKGLGQHVFGSYNIPDDDTIENYYDTSEHLIIVGNGDVLSDNGVQSNAHTLDWSGNAWFAGDVYVGSNSGTNKDSGSKKLATSDAAFTTNTDVKNNTMMALVASDMGGGASETYTNDFVYIGEDNCLYSNNKKVSVEGHNHNDMYYTEDEIDSKLTDLVGDTAVSEQIAEATKNYAGGTAITLNGTSKASNTASFYAPTSAGTSGYFLKSNGSGSAPTWASAPTSYTHPSHTSRTSGLYKVTVDSQGHVTNATAVQKSDITNLGIPAQDTQYTHPTTAGNKHIPSGGSTGQFLGYASSGTAQWVDAPSANIDVFSTSANGLVPNPSSQDRRLFLNTQGQWLSPEAICSSNSTNKLYLIGATSQSTTGWTHSNVSCYTENGHLYSNGSQVLTQGSVQAGTGSFTINSNDSNFTTIYFDSSFSSAPIVVATITGNMDATKCQITVQSTSTRSATIMGRNYESSALTVNFNWIAVGL